MGRVPNILSKYKPYSTLVHVAPLCYYLLLYIGVTISILIGYKHAANSCWLCIRYVIPTDNSFYTCRSDVIPTDNSFMHAEVTSPNTLNSSLSNFVMAASTSRFATLSAENLDLLLDDKDVN